LKVKVEKENHRSDVAFASALRQQIVRDDPFFAIADASESAKQRPRLAARLQSDSASRRRLDARHELA
jgi:hypothetical protein